MILGNATRTETTQNMPLGNISYLAGDTLSNQDFIKSLLSYHTIQGVKLRLSINVSN